MVPAAMSEWGAQRRALFIHSRSIKQLGTEAELVGAALWAGPP